MKIRIHDDIGYSLLSVRRAYWQCEDLRVFLKTAGADSPRPMKLRQKGSTGEWFLWEYSSVLSGIRVPASEDPWA